MKLNKKAIGEVIATISILILVVSAGVYFSGWYSGLNSSILAGKQIKVTQDSVNIEYLDSDKIYIKNNNKINLTIQEIKIEDKSCGIETELLGSGTYGIDLQNCLVGFEVGPKNVVIITNGGIFEDTLYLDSKYKISQFISIWNTSAISAGSSNATQVKLPLELTGTYNFIVDWGDGTNDTVTTWNGIGTNHTYLSEGIYQIEIKGTINGFRFNNLGDKLKFLEIKEYGPLNLGNNGYYFYGCSNFITISATDTLNLTATTNLVGTFGNANKFNGDISSWDVSNIIIMSEMFLSASSFNQPLNNWNTSSVTNMNYMFLSASSFNQSLNNWDTSLVTNMNYMFSDLDNFNHNLSMWDVGNVVQCRGFSDGTLSWILPKPNLTCDTSPFSAS